MKKHMFFFAACDIMESQTGAGVSFCSAYPSTKWIQARRMSYSGNSVIKYPVNAVILAHPLLKYIGL